MHEEQQAFPAPQREPQRKLAERVGVERKAVARSVSGPNGPVADLVEPDPVTPDPEPEEEPVVCEPVTVQATIRWAPPHIAHAYALRASLADVEPETPEQAETLSVIALATDAFINAYGWKESS